MKVTFIDLNEDLIKELNKEITRRRFQNTTAICKDFRHFKADSIVSPANSFGDMTGGIDLAYRKHFGEDVEVRLKQAIFFSHEGELLVGDAISVKIEKNSDRYKYLIAAPTMRVPMILGTGSVNPYLATRAAIRRANTIPGVNSIAIPGMGTGVGNFPLDLAAYQMCEAILDVDKIKVPNLSEAFYKHRSLIKI